MRHRPPNVGKNHQHHSTRCVHFPGQPDHDSQTRSSQHTLQHARPSKGHEKLLPQPTHLVIDVERAADIHFHSNDATALDHYIIIVREYGLECDLCKQAALAAAGHIEQAPSFLVVGLDDPSDGDSDQGKKGGDEEAASNVGHIWSAETPNIVTAGAMTNSAPDTQVAHVTSITTEPTILAATPIGSSNASEPEASGGLGGASTLATPETRQTAKHAVGTASNNAKTQTSDETEVWEGFAKTEEARKTKGAGRVRS
ncbi:hypothetical protein H2198_007023 [Neophaeococcomyces mojaviensis]|uniref:Uncharacterized protein n=1 Tax=Neophaeococcomyces mojaviensis TaxID=3383035 RepID=A0ACC3A1Y1_9EURO|nr:hypothetical protein H2198_007023 [Knufia sp. JES_112]